MKKIKINKKLIIGGSIILASAIGIYSYYLYETKHPSTDNAYVKSNIVNISPQVSGYIEKVYVHNDERVTKGQLLIKIDSAPYILQEKDAQAKLDIAHQNIVNTMQQIKIAKANIVKEEYANNYAQSLKDRYEYLYMKKSGSLQDKDSYSNKAAQSKQQLKLAILSLSQAKSAYVTALINVKYANIQLEKSKLNLKYTELKAPTDGYISNLNIYAGQLVQSGEKLFGFIESKTWWVNANFKETNISRIKVGQKASVVLDSYSHEYAGKVIGISHASGNTFSLLPAQNATGNWVKVTQRYVVKIALKDNKEFPLRVGASAEVTIDTV